MTLKHFHYDTYPIYLYSIDRLKKDLSSGEFQRDFMAFRPGLFSKLKFGLRITGIDEKAENLRLVLGMLQDAGLSRALGYLDISGNGIKSLPTGLLFPFTKLKALDLHDNKLRAFPFEILSSRHSKLMEIDLSDNRLKSLAFDDFHLLPSLISIQVQDNPLNKDNLQEGLEWGLVEANPRFKKMAQAKRRASI